MRILITGASGLVGRNIVEKLAPLFGLHTPGLDEFNLLNYQQIHDYIGKLNPDLIIHCAGLVGGIQANVERPLQFLVENFELGKNVIIAAKENNIRRLLNLGSSCMYPRNAPNPLREDMILTGELEPTNEGYAIAKIAVQRLCSYVNRQYSGFQYKTLIPCNLYGRWDKFDPKEAHLIPAAIRKVHEAMQDRKDLVEIWGTGKARREFMYAGDLADFVSFAIDRFDELPEIMNVGLGHDYSIDEYYQSVASVLGFRGRFEHDLSKPEGMKQKVVDISFLRRFGWAPKVTLEEGIRFTYEFYLEQSSGRQGYSR
jgi:GDP-L-fucose synthase